MPDTHTIHRNAEQRQPPRDRQPAHDPYAPPPLKKDGTGAVVRLGVAAVLLAGAVWGFTCLRNSPSTLGQPVETSEISAPAPAPQQFAETATIPEAVTPAPAVTAPPAARSAPVAPQRQPAPAPEQAQPAIEATPEPVPAPMLDAAPAPASDPVIEPIDPL